MNFQQLRYLVAVRDNGLSITAAARTLHTSQPAVSRQIQLLERELGFQLFERQGRSLSKATSAGEEILSRAESVMREVQNIRRASAEYADPGEESLTVATTHTQARYVLPDVVRNYRAAYPKIRINIHQGSSEQIVEMLVKGRADFAVTTGAPGLFPGIIRLPLYRWHLGVVVPKRHPLARKRSLSLKDIAKYPIVTYEFGLDSGASVLAPFEREGLHPQVALTAQDADVVKEYVRIGLGVGLVAPFAVDRVEDAELAVLDASSLFVEHTSWIGFRAGAFLNSSMQQFVHMMAPHLPAERIRLAQVQTVSFDDIVLPFRGSAVSVSRRKSS